MIVKNESRIIERCLAALAPHIDCFVICDTGSTDRTAEIIERFFAQRSIPGEIHRTSFVNFEQARNEALDAARASPIPFDYLLLCDADMELVVEHPDYRDGLTQPAYMLTQRTVGGTLEYENLRLLRRDVPARYRGVTHEYLDVGNVAHPVLRGVWYLDHASGANRTTKYERDISLLEQGLRNDPTNTRYMFYLANSYYDLGDAARALVTYDKRAAMGGWREEVFYSEYRAALCLQKLGREAEMIQRLLLAFDRFPHRAEPLHTLALHHQRRGEHRLAFHFADIASSIPMPTGALFIEPEVYRWRCTDIKAVSLFYMGRRRDGERLNKQLLEVVPENERPRVFRNLQFCEAGA
jgi:tetratricopeptide (TPR) repeat protein